MSKKLFCVDKEYKIIVEVYPEEVELDYEHPMLLYFEDEREAVKKLISILEKELDTYKDILTDLNVEKYNL